MLTEFLKPVSITLLTTLLTISYSFVPVNAHTFSGDESASFISLTDQIKSALLVITQSNSSDIDGMKEQGKYAKIVLNDSMVKEINEKNKRLATELQRALDSLQDISEDTKVNSNITKILDLISDTIISRVERDQLENITIHALAVAEDVDKVFKEYSTAFNQNATSMNMNVSHMDMNKNMTPDNVTLSEVPLDMGVYDRAVSFADIIIDRFDTELRGKSGNVSSEEDALSGLEHLRKAMESKELPADLLGIIHGEIHPNLQIAYGLKLANTMSDQNNATQTTQHQMKM